MALNRAQLIAGDSTQGPVIAGQPQGITAGPGLSIDANGVLTITSGGLAFTAKGQLIVGTGAGTSVYFNSGTDTAALVANAGSASGLSYTNSITTALLLPVGNDTTGRPASPTVGQLRYNTEAADFEGYSGSPAAWRPLGGVPTGSGGDKVFFNNGQAVTANYTIPTGQNAMSAGPITINSGITVNVTGTSTWTVV